MLLISFILYVYYAFTCKNCFKIMSQFYLKYMPLKSCPAHTLQPLSFKPTFRNKRTFRLANNKSFYITLFKNHVMALKGETKNL
jgi:hypothetical protein